MRTQSLERRRRQLSRHYKLTVEGHMVTREGRASNGLTSRWQRFSTWVETQFLPHYFTTPPRWRLLIRRFGGKRTLPDFCIIGPVKGGTSDLAVSMMLHPNVMAPLAKEIWLSDPETWRIYYPTERGVQRHAKRHGLALSPYFVPCLNRMEIAYILSRQRPDTKIVLALRNPSERVFSQWKWQIFLTGRQRASKLPFLATFPAYVDKSLEIYPDLPMFPSLGFQALQTSIYWAAVKHWIDCFGSQNVLVVDVGEYFRDRDSCLRKIQKFVGLPYFAMPAYTDKVNENPLGLPPADEASLSKLNAFFKPYNDKLWGVIGKEFAW